jgi:hypothetical protein
MNASFSRDLEDKLKEQIGDQKEEADHHQDDDYLEREPPAWVDVGVFIL